MSSSHRPRLLAELAATAELLKVDLSDGAARVLLADLEPYDEQAILAALHRLRVEGGRFNVDAIVQRLPGMWPGPEQAWAEFPKDEAASGCVTDQAMQAWGVASELADSVAARMAFKETYQAAVAHARAQGLTPHWSVTLGSDPDLRELAILKGVREQRLSLETAAAYLPHIPAEELPALARGEQPLQLTDDSVDQAQMEQNRRRVAALLRELRE